MNTGQRAKVYVGATGRPLQIALERSLSRCLDGAADVVLEAPNWALGRAVVVTTDMAAAREDVAQLAGLGALVVVLAALPNELAVDLLRVVVREARDGRAKADG